MPRPIVVVLVSANAEWAPVKEYLVPGQVERTPYGEYFTRSLGDGEIVFLHGGWGKISEDCRYSFRMPAAPCSASRKRSALDDELNAGLA